jgi:hypothetical protein
MIVAVPETPEVPTAPKSYTLEFTTVAAGAVVPASSLVQLIKRSGMIIINGSTLLLKCFICLIFLGLTLNKNIINMIKTQVLFVKTH